MITPATCKWFWTQSRVWGVTRRMTRRLSSKIKWSSPSTKLQRCSGKTRTPCWLIAPGPWMLQPNSRCSCQDVFTALSQAKRGVLSRGVQGASLKQKSQKGFPPRRETRAPQARIARTSSRPCPSSTLKTTGNGRCQSCPRFIADS